MTKRILIVLFILFAVSTAYSKDKWSMIEYSSGPVSPEYQYNYSITIDESGAATISSTKGTGVKKDATFTVSRKNLKKLTSAIKKTKILTTDPNEMQIQGSPKIGGSVQYARVSVINTNPNLDQGPRKIEFPRHLNSTYSKNVMALYALVESLVPSSTLEEIK